MVAGSSSEPLFPIFKERVQNLKYTYDAAGNITTIVDRSDTVSAATTTYTYDALYRLRTASTTMASTSGYKETYSYNALGNITNKSDQGSYSYQGNTGSNYANPHAVTSLAGVTYKYDKNGNLASTTANTSYTWDYLNRLSESVESGNTVTYKYDHAGQRVSKSHASGTTVYPSSLYEVTGATSTKHIYAGDQLIASIEENTPAPKVYYNHLDHLNSTSVVTDDLGYTTQVLAYYPFGDLQIDNQYSSIDTSKKFTGFELDRETDLNYAGARYYDGGIGRFTVQDPVALELGDWKEVAKMTRISQEDFLKQPQKHNSYGYAGNNPLRYVDPHGESYWELNAGMAVNPYTGNFGLKIDFENSRMDFTYGAGAAAGASADLSLLYNPDDLPEAHSYITEEVEGVAGYGVVARGSYGAQIGSPKPGDIEFNGGMSYGVGAGAGLSAGVTANHSFTVVDYSRNYNILKAALTKFAENLKAYSDFQKEQRKPKDDDNN